MTRWLPHLTGLGALVLALALVFAAPLPEGVPAAAVRALQGAMGAGIWVLAAIGLGGALLGRSTAPEALGLGLGALGLALLPIGMIGGLAPPMLAGVAVAGAAGWLRRPQLSGPGLPALLLAVALPLLAAGALDALAPPVDTDELYQHLALPAKMLATGGLPGGLLQPDGSRPLPLHLVYAGALALGGEPGPKLLHLALSAALLLQLWTMASRAAGRPAALASTLALLGSYTVVRELGLAHNNLPTALLLLLSLDAALLGRRWRMAVFAGMALAAKYTAAPAVVGIYLLYWWRRGPRAVPEMALLTAAALALVCPWWLRNAIEGLHPLFPYAGWPAGDRFVFVYPERYGVGRGWQDMLLLPWNLTVHAETDSYRFLGRLSPLGLVLLPALLVALGKHRGIVAVAAVSFAGWAVGPQWLRYLLPALPLIALALGCGYARMPRWGRAVALGAWLVGLPANWGPWLGWLSEGAPVALGLSEREPLLAEKVPGWESVRWVNEYAPADARVAVLFAWPSYYLERPWVLGSVEDHVPTRHLLVVQGDDALALLQELGVTHLLAGRVHFIHKSYPFLDEDAFAEQFTATEEQLERLLLADGTMVQEHGRYAVWRLNPR